MALIRTFLTAPVSASVVVWPISNTSVGFPPVGTVAANQPVLCDDELAFITGVPAIGLITVRGRGSEGTKADAHDINAAVITSSTSQDFPVNVPGAAVLRPVTAPDLDSYGQSGAISIPTQDTKAQIDGTAAITLTLGPPSLAANAVELVLFSATPFAHVISAPGLIQNGAAGTPFGTVTFPAQAGATLWLIGSNGFWVAANFTPGMAFA